MKQVILPPYKCRDRQAWWCTPVIPGTKEAKCGGGGEGEGRIGEIANVPGNQQAGREVGITCQFFLLQSLVYFNYATS
jgi:hypothetical protein